MKILIDIGHPAHVHYFRNFICIMQSCGHKFFVVARDKEVTHQLLQSYGINFVSRGKGRRGLIGKSIYVIEADLRLLNYARNFKADILLSFGSPYAAHISRLLKKPHIAFDDTEHAVYEHLMYIPFTNVILTPNFFIKDFGNKQIKFDSYMELNYLHPKYFKRDVSIKNELGIKDNDKYIVLRFVLWGASHDIGQKGLTNKSKLVNYFKDRYRIFISSEGLLPNELEKFRLNVHPSKLHQVLANSTLYIGEGSTTASECAVLGVPSIYVSTLYAGNCTEQEKKYGLCYHLKNDSNVIEHANKMLADNNLETDWQTKRIKMLKEKIDVTSFMVWFVENYPESFFIMKKNPDYQYKFR